MKSLTVKNFDNKAQLKIEKSDDLRSYHISSNKIDNILKFKPINSVEDAIKDLKKLLKKIYCLIHLMMKNTLISKNLKN